MQLGTVRVGHIAIACFYAIWAATASAAEQDKVIYNREVLPLLADRCFLCHGPDEGVREAELRLDVRDDATRDRDGSFVVKPGNPDASEMIARLTTEDEDLVMPPPDSGQERLTPDEVDLVRRWIKQGADWSLHWAFVAPVRPEVPQVEQSEWVNNPIDAFVLRRLQKEGISPSPQANRVTLLRRLSLDLIGLPPTLEEIDAFLADERPDAYEKQVLRLLKSPHYGERWGRIWLDAARYADSDGFEKDKPREVWFYRDWVINALNRDLPYDQFIVEQIAGDLLPNATQDQIVATGFLRNSMLNEEGGIDPEEFRMQAMFDRMDTVGKAILGFAVQCGQCHSHKYDPFTKRDYYQMFAFLNNSHEAQPTVYTREQQERRDDIRRQVSEIEQRIRAENADWSKRMAEWEASVREDQPTWTMLPVENTDDTSQRYFPQGDGSLLAQGYAPTRFDAHFSVTSDLREIRSFRLGVLNHPNLPAGGPGRAFDGQFALTEFKVQAESVGDPKQKVTVKIVRATADFSNERTQLGKPFVDDSGKSAGVTGSVEYAIDGDNDTAWGIDAGPGRRNLPRKAVFVADRNVAFPGGTKLTFTLVQRQGGSNSDNNETMNLGRFRLSATAGETAADPLPSHVRKLLNVTADQRTDAQQQAVFSYWRSAVADFKDANSQIAALWKMQPEGTTQFVLQQRDVLRPTHMLARGDFLKPTEKVDPGAPGFLHSLPTNEKHDRLHFARWIVDRRSPTTARSIVNRVWQAYFGTGIVETAEDLGSQGGTPSHPQLLDWLAVELMDNGWSLKHLHRLIVMSNTYQQTSARGKEGETRRGGEQSEAISPSPSLPVSRSQIDPGNRLLSCGPRFRVDAEIVRDIFLAASGLLNKKVGGRSVYPPAPEFLFQRPASYGPKHWAYETDAEKYRRALYTFRFRSVPYPALQTFDAPSGEFSTVRRSRSNTPLQALTTLNEPLFVECAHALARRAVTEGGDRDEDRLALVFRCCVARRPTNDEAKVLLDVLHQQVKRLNGGESNPSEIFGGDAPETDGVTRAELAAWTVVSRIILNLDETITKE
ncbi:MAG: hypothetical protein CMJ64_09300 [Planctomycetaceae bacterium]|nr:hypothetical protein [Planctomycetaceae bacterium]